MTDKNRRQKNENSRLKAAAELFSYENILKCYYECRRRKRYTVNAAKFEMEFENELLKLQKELKERTYQPGRSICFVVTKPKAREIFAADFRDRIVHHVLVNYLEPIWEPKFIGQSYACRKGKGAHKAIGDLRKYMRRIKQDSNCQLVHFFQADIQSFFISLDKDILFNLIKKHVKNPEVLWLARTIIFHNPTYNYYRKCQTALFDLIPDHKSLFKASSNRGLPIGNLTSQFFANIYLNELDQFAKHELKIKHYLRYVDDFIMLSSDRELLKSWRDQIRNFLREKLGLKLHPAKQIMQNADKGINFVGFITKPSHVLIRRQTVKSFKRKLWEFNRDFRVVTKEKIFNMISVVNSYYGQFKHAKTLGLRRKLYDVNFRKLKRFLVPIDEKFSYFKIN